MLVSASPDKKKYHVSVVCNGQKSESSKSIKHNRNANSCARKLCSNDTIGVQGLAVLL